MTNQLRTIYRASEEIIDYNLAVINHRYGEHSVQPHHYHNQNHSFDVVTATRELAEIALKNDRIGHLQAVLLPLAASGHDLSYEKGCSGINEQRSADETIATMHEYGCFTDEQCTFIRKLILGTVVVEFYPKLNQAADPKCYPSKILADADLSSFGMPFADFKKRALQYYDELRVGDTVNDLAQYVAFERTILSNHQWHTPEAASLFPHLEDNLANVDSLEAA